MGEQVRLRLPCNPSSPRRARHEVVDRLAWLGCERRRSAVALVVSELVTNAVLHASSEVEVSVAVEREDMTIEVSDRGQEWFEPRAEMALDAEFGRGMNLVQSVAEDWGSRRDPAGKTVWCRLRCNSRCGGRTGTGRGVAQATGGPSTGS